MQAAITALTALGAFNAMILRVCRVIGVGAIGVMVLAILIQVFFRYVLNNALPWPDEAARFCMLWMTGLLAPIAFRAGGFVAIDMLVVALPRVVGAMLGLVLLCLSALVLVVAVQIGWSEVNGIGGRFATASLYLPLSLDFSDWFRVPRKWMMMSIFVGVCLLLWINIELILRALVGLAGRGDDLPPIDSAARAD